MQNFPESLKHQLRTEQTQVKRDRKELQIHTQNQVQTLGQNRLLRASPISSLKPWNAGESKAPLGPSPTTGLSSWEKGFTLYPAWAFCASASPAASCAPTTHALLSGAQLYPSPPVLGVLLSAPKAIPSPS